MAKKNPRALWLPRLPEVKRKCESCPLRHGNDEEFGAVLVRLKRANGKPGVVSSSEIQRARAMVLKDVLDPPGGEFYCHRTVYDLDNNMRMRGESERRQCLGASELYRRCNG